MDASPIYMYVSIFVTVFSTYQLLHSNTRYWRVDNNVYTLQLHAKEAIILPAQKINLTTEEDKNWIYRKYVRCAHQDDESEPASPLVVLNLDNNYEEDFCGTICIHIYK